MTARSMIIAIVAPVVIVLLVGSKLPLWANWVLVGASIVSALCYAAGIVLWFRTDPADRDAHWYG